MKRQVGVLVGGILLSFAGVANVMVPGLRDLWSGSSQSSGDSSASAGSGVQVVPGANQSSSAASAVANVSASATKPESAIAPWYVPARIDALKSSERDGFTVLYGDYWERSEDPSYIRYQAASQELGRPKKGAYAAYSGLDMGSGVESLMLRISLPSGSSAVELRMDSLNGPTAGPVCDVPTTGSTTVYRTISCALDPAVAQGANRTLYVRVLSDNPALRLNWLGFWARNTTQKIDELADIQNDKDVNRPLAHIRQAGTPTRTVDLLPPEGARRARTYGQWAPSQIGDCPAWLHDTYWTIEDDQKVYPTWHPPVDYNPDTGQYCTFGHEHGSDPNASNIYSSAGKPAFGYVSENHEPSAQALQRNEDHYGYKVLIANDFTFYNPLDTADRRNCNVMLTMHVGTHSADAFANTAHEVHTAGVCEGLESFKTRQFYMFGSPGRFTEAQAEGCGAVVESGLTPSPINQPIGGMMRSGPTASCFLRGSSEDQTRLAKKRLLEYWLTSFLGGSLYYTISNPSRHLDMMRTDRLGRNVDLCYVPGHPLQSTLECQETVASSRSAIGFSDPRSSFRGSIHSNTHFSSLKFAGSATRTVYTNAWGQNPLPSPDPARGIVIPQTVPTRAFHYRADGGASRIPNVDHSSGGRNGVRAPN